MTGKATLEDKILQNIAGLWQDVLYDIFVYLHKDYGVLEQGRDLEILEGYGVGLQVYQLLIYYWDRATMTERESRYYEYLLQWSRGFNQWDPPPLPGYPMLWGTHLCATGLV